MPYNPSFITGFHIPLPRISHTDGIAGAPLHYHHHSIIMNTGRKFAYFSASNTDGLTWQPIERKGGFKKDSNIEDNFQLGDELYSSISGRDGRKNDFDEGHLTSFQEVLWGRDQDSKQAGEDTFFYTNCVPQHGSLNRGAWRSLEQYLVKKGADPYLMTRQGETSWDMVREKSTEEIFFIHFDRTELRRMSNLKREDPCADLHDEYLSLSEYRPKEITCRTRHEIEIRDMNTPKGGHRFNKSAKDNDECKSPTNNLKNLVEVNVTQNTFLSRHNRFISTEEPYSGKTHCENRNLSASAGPKKHKYYVYFKKMKAQHLSTFRENKDP
ncbi:MAG: hypothetical protein EOO02_21015 [Chitinophagaceae bacterium]|nr:MAG: hypothetical protein EOO02_21015 [Chitinophagaceae bacterium]